MPRRVPRGPAIGRLIRPYTDPSNEQQAVQSSTHIDLPHSRDNQDEQYERDDQEGDEPSAGGGSGQSDGSGQFNGSEQADSELAHEDGTSMHTVPMSYIHGLTYLFMVRF